MLQLSPDLFGMNFKSQIENFLNKITCKTFFSNQSQTTKCEEPPRPFTSKDKIKEIYFALQNAKRPLIVIGKGAAYAQAENELNKLVKNLKLPFLPTPMGKGVVDDNSELCIAAARST